MEPQERNIEVNIQQTENEGFDDIEEEHQILAPKENYQKQPSVTDLYFAVPAPNPILAKNVIEINKPKILIRQVEYYLQPQQLLSSNMHRQILSQDKPHNISFKKYSNANPLPEFTQTIWQKYISSQKYDAVYLKYYKQSLKELKKKSFKKYKTQLSKLCHNNPNIFSAYLVDLAFLSDYGTCLLQSLKTKTMEEKIQEHNNLGIEECDLAFDSRFQCGNLFAVFIEKESKKIDEYDLILQSDVNTKGYSNWFYFSIKIPTKRTIKFNVINLQKQHSLFTSGMKVAVFSYQRKEKQNIEWHRDGYNYCYFQNQIIKINIDQPSNYSTLSFCYDAKYDDDLVYFAANMPYSYTKMLKFVDHVEKIAKLNTSLYLKKETIALTISTNPCPILTLTWKRDKKKYKIKTRKKIIGVIARQHPSETVSSYVMEGFINALVMLKNQSSVELLQNYIFKIVPMVNIDGVIYGNSRCDLSGTDVNRKWTRNPNKFVYPVLAGIKGLFNRLKMEEYEFDYFIDLHGHSRQLGTFIYGCKTYDEIEYKQLSWIMSKLNTKFMFDYCSFGLSAYKRETARGIMSELTFKKKALTLQTSFYGYKSGTTKHFQIKDLHKIGSTLLQAVYAEIFKDPKIFNWETLTDELKEYLDATKYKRRRNKKLSSQNSDQSSEEGDSDSDPEVDEMNEKEKAELFLDPTVANKIGLQEVKVVKKSRKKNESTKKSVKEHQSEVKKYQRIVDGFNQKLEEFVQRKSDLMQQSIVDQQQKLKRSKNFLIRETKSTTKIIPFKFSQRSSLQKKLSIKKARKSVQLLPFKPQKLAMPQIQKLQKKNNFWSNLKKQYEVLVEEKKINMLKRDDTMKDWGKLSIPITAHSKYRSTQFL